MKEKVMSFKPVLNAYWDENTPVPSSSWIELQENIKLQRLNDLLATFKLKFNVVCTKANVNGEVFLKLNEPIPVNERLEFLLDLELKIKSVIDEGLYLSCEPIGDRNSLRKLRGIEVKFDKSAN